MSFEAGMPLASERGPERVDPWEETGEPGSLDLLPTRPPPGREQPCVWLGCRPSLSAAGSSVPLACFQSSH